MPVPPRRKEVLRLREGARTLSNTDDGAQSHVGHADKGNTAGATAGLHIRARLRH